MDRLSARFPAGDSALRAALRREHVQPELLDLSLAYTGVSWSLHVTCASLGYRRVEQLPPEDLRVDTAWGELCEAIALDVAERFAQAGTTMPERLTGENN
jgi:hypothetical protein